MVNDEMYEAALDAWPDPTPVLDPSATILAVNRAWRMFGLDNGGRPKDTGTGVNYLDVCTQSAAAGCEDAERAAAGLLAVLDGTPSTASWNTRARRRPPAAGSCSA